MLRIGEIARKHGLSRSTLLYYDRIGLLRPSGRSGSNYRRYSAEDDERLGRICLYRRTGLALEEIQKLLEGGKDDLARRLESQLGKIAAQIEELRDRQRLIVQLLEKPKLLARTGALNREKWVRLLRLAGFSEDDMHRWHQAFERNSPHGHQAFLAYLCIPEEEIRRIRLWSR